MDPEVEELVKLYHRARTAGEPDLVTFAEAAMQAAVEARGHQERVVVAEAFLTEMLTAPGDRTSGDT